MKPATHYGVLEVVETASNEAIKGAYKYLAQKWHPDKNLSNTHQANQRLSLINRAYETLSNPLLREAYDRQLFEMRRTTDASSSNASMGTQTGAPGERAPRPQPKINPSRSILRNADLIFGFVFVGFIVNIATWLIFIWISRTLELRILMEASYLIPGVPWYLTYLTISAFVAYQWAQMKPKMASTFADANHPIYKIIGLTFILFMIAGKLSDRAHPIKTSSPQAEPSSTKIVQENSTPAPSSSPRLANRDPKPYIQLQGGPKVAVGGLSLCLRKRYALEDMSSMADGANPQHKNILDEKTDAFNKLCNLRLFSTTELLQEEARLEELRPKLREAAQEEFQALLEQTQQPIGRATASSSRPARPVNKN